MNDPGFALDARLAADTVPLGVFELCQVRLMDDARFPWLVLVPQRPGLTEVLDLEPADRDLLWRETLAAADALRRHVPCDKLNFGMLGNLVRQLHVHVVARREGDAAWHGPVWGSGTAVRHAPSALAERAEHLRAVLGL
ncbi:MAG: HIT family protein [Fulvimonas sp.]|nr:HIT family protein [Fulvimonas sp.]